MFFALWSILNTLFTTTPLLLSRFYCYVSSAIELHICRPKTIFFYRKHTEIQFLEELFQPYLCSCKFSAYAPYNMDIIHISIHNKYDNIQYVL